MYTKLESLSFNDFNEWLAIALIPIAAKKEFGVVTIFNPGGE